MTTTPTDSNQGTDMGRKIAIRGAFEAPLHITSHLSIGVAIGDSTVTLMELEELPTPPGYRVYCTFLINTPEFGYQDGQMSAPNWGKPDIVSIFENFLGFLEAAAESASRLPEEEWADSDSNSSLFPPHVVKWAVDHASDISDVRCQLENGDDETSAH